jgi:dienelactone hydrolase
VRPEVLSKDGSAKRELMVYLGYPADGKGKNVKTAPYLPGAAAINKLSDRALVEGEGKLWRAILSGQIETYSVEGAPIARSSGRFPVLIFSHGLGSPVFHYTSLIDGLVSQGYVVASIQHTYEVNAVAFPDGTVVALSPISWRIYGPQPPEVSEEEPARKAVAWEKDRDNVWAADISFVPDRLEKLDRNPDSLFTGKLDMVHVGAFGHSIGGRAVGRACQLDRRITACVNLDGAPHKGVVLNYPGAESPVQPFLLEEAFVAPPSDEELADAHESRQHFNASVVQQDAAVEKQLLRCRDGGWRVTIKSPGINHDSFTDMPVLQSVDHSKAEADARHSLSLAIDLTRAFFDKYLKAGGHTLVNDEKPNDEITVRHYQAGSDQP